MNSTDHTLINNSISSFVVRFQKKYVAYELGGCNNKRGKKLASHLCKLIQQAIVEVDVLLERLKLWTIHKTDHNINSLQYRLFLLSMAVDRRFDI